MKSGSRKQGRPLLQNPSIYRGFFRAPVAVELFGGQRQYDGKKYFTIYVLEMALIQ